MTGCEDGIAPVDHERLVQSVGDPVFTLDADGRFVFANDALCDTLGRDREAVVGTDFRAVTVEESVDRAETAFERVRSPETPVRSTTCEKVVLGADGDRIPVETRFSRVEGPDGQTQVAGVVRDIGDRKRRERRLRAENERLDQFASFVGHDLRNPIDVARTRIEVATETGDQSHLDHAADALDRMERTVEDLLTLARDGASAEEREPVDVGTVARRVWRSLATDAGTLDVTTDRTVTADRGGLRHLLENLLRNAIRHNPGAVTVTVGDTTDGFYVADDGRGLPVDVTDAVAGGSPTGGDHLGIGLAIVASVVETHGWDLTATESAEGGARFEVAVA